MKSIYRLILRTKLNFETKEKEKKAFEPFLNWNLPYLIIYLIFRLFNFIQKEDQERKRKFY